MKATSSIAVVALIVTIGCGSENSNEQIPTTETSSTTTSAPQMSATVETSDTSATTTGVTGGTVTYMSNDDKTFVVSAGASGIAEVGLSTTAAERSTNSNVRDFAARMVKDHGQANEELKALAIAKGMGLPTSVDEKHKEIGDKLEKLSGREFDREYMIAMVQDHEKAVAEFDKAARQATDADVKAWAAKKLPALREHLKMAKDIQRGMK